MRRVMARRTRHAAARVGARPTHVEPGDGRAVIAMTQHRPRGIELIERHVAVEDVATDQPELAFEVERRVDLAGDDARLEVGRMLRDGIDDMVGDLFAHIVPRPPVRQPRLELLAEQAGDMLARRREAVIDRGRQLHLDDRGLRPAEVARASV